MEFSYCDKKMLENSKRWVEYLDAKAQSCKEIYEKCMKTKTGQCHLILNDYNLTLKFKGDMSDVSNQIDLKCQIEEETFKRLNNQKKG